MESEDELEVKLQKSRYEIVQRLQLDRTSLLDYLRSKGIFDAGDCDLVLSEKTREQKASKFLDILETKGEDGFACFVDALQLLNPTLYEKITGKKANPGRIWDDIRDRFALADCGYIPDVDILSSQLKKTIGDLHDLAMRYQEVLKENQALGKQLGQASTDLDFKHRRVERLEKQMVDTEKGVVEAHNNANKLSEVVVQQLRCLQQGICERNTYIIALQMKLLAAEEETKETRNFQEDLRHQHDALLSKWKELSRNYDLERRESMKLSEKLKTQKGRVEKVSEFEKRCREQQFVNQKLIAEQEETACQLNGLKDWTEALKAKFDLVTDEYKQLQQSFVSAAADNCKLKEEMEGARLHLSLSRIGVSDLKSWNEELEEGIKEYREQRDFFSESRKEALLERDQARKERDEAVQRYNDVIQSRDDMITRQCNHTKHFEQKCEKTHAELRPLRKKLADAEMEIAELRSHLRAYEEKEVSEKEAKEDHVEEVDIDVQEAELDAMNGTGNDESDSPQGTQNGGIEGFPWNKRRETTTIIDSVRRRVAGTQNTPIKTLSLDRELEPIISPRASNILQTGKVVFKSPPSYSTLQCMFANSLGRNILGLPVVDNTAQSTGKENSDVSTSSGSLSSTSGDWHEEVAVPFDGSSDGSDDTGTNDVATRLDMHIEENDKKENSGSPLTVRPPPYNKCLSVPAIKVSAGEHSEGEPKFENSYEEISDIDNSYHWVRTDQCGNPVVNSTPEGYSGSPNSSFELSSEDNMQMDGKTREEVNTFFQTLSSRQPFRQRAWAIRKRKPGRSSSDPMIQVHPGNEGDTVKTSTQ